MSRSSYGRSPCWICGTVISVAGFAQYNHKMAHVRRGEMVIRNVTINRMKRMSRVAKRFFVTEKGKRRRLTRLSPGYKSGYAEEIDG